MTLLVLPFATYVVLVTMFNEAFHIKRAFPKAQVSPSHRFTQVLSLWDLFGALVPGDYVSPIDNAEVIINRSEKPVDVSKLLGFRVTGIQISDSEVVNFYVLLNGHEPNIPINLINPVFPGASPQDLQNLEEHKKHDVVSGKTRYFFGSV